MLAKDLVYRPAEFGDTIETQDFSITNNWGPEFTIFISEEEVKKRTFELGIPPEAFSGTSVLVTSDVTLQDGSFMGILRETYLNSEIQIAAGYFTQLVVENKGSLSSDGRDETFLSVALSMTIVDGLLNVAGFRGRISPEDVVTLNNQHIESILSGENPIFIAWVGINGNVPVKQLTH